MTLNELFKAINIALAIPPKERPALMVSGGRTVTNSAISGYWRRADDNRFRYIPPLAFLAFCRGVVANRPPDNAAHLAALQQIIATLEQGDKVADAMLRAFEEPEP